MLTDKKPTATTLYKKQLSDFITRANQDIYVIEDVIQREFVWGKKDLGKWFDDFKICVDKNLENKASLLFEDNEFNSKYFESGAIEISEIEECNKNLCISDSSYHSTVDGSQKIRACFIGGICFKMLLDKQGGNEYVNLDMFKTNNGEWKVQEFGLDGKFEEMISYALNTKISDILKICEDNCDKNSKKFETDNETREYIQTLYFIMNLIKDRFSKGYQISDVIKIYLKNVYFSEEYVPIEAKFDRYEDRNRKGTRMSDESFYPKAIISKFKGEDKTLILKKYDDFKKEAKRAQMSDKKSGLTRRFRRTKQGLDAIIYSMNEVLKILLGEYNIKKPFSSCFTISSTEYGVSDCYEKGLIFNNITDTIRYFDTCKEFCKFLSNESFTNNEDKTLNCYFLRDFAKEDVIWWYFIKPCFLKNKYCDFEKRKFLCELFIRIYNFYIIKRTSDTNSQNLINLLEDLSFLIISYKNEDISTFKKALLDRTNSYMITPNYDWSNFRTDINVLNYSKKNNRGAMENIFLMMEYYMINKYGLDDNNFFISYKKNPHQKFNLDHFKPKNKMTDEEIDNGGDSIGNMVIIESSLNKSKQDDERKNGSYYKQSRYYSTLLIENDSRGELTNKQLEQLDKDELINLRKLNEEKVNQPTLDIISERKTKIVTFGVRFIKDFMEQKL